MKTLLYNARLVLYDEVTTNSTLLIEDNYIAAVNTPDLKADYYINLKNNLLLPGFVDLHCDVIERDVEMRPSVFFPMDMAFKIADRRCAFSGITTQYHGISFGHEKRGLRSNELAEQLVSTITKLKSDGIIDNKILIRYEISDIDAFAVIKRLLLDGYADMLSFMDHTPSAAAYTAVENWSIQNSIITGESVNCENTFDAQSIYNRMKQLSELAVIQQIPLGSHDDKTLARLELMDNLHIYLSEFPLNEHIACEAVKKGFYTIMGGPNAVRGGSHLNWLGAADAIEKGLARCLCSDYHPTILPMALFKLYKNNIASLPELVKLFSWNPAQAAKLTDRGALKPGLRADMIEFDDNNNWPEIKRVWVNGKNVLSTSEDIGKQDSFQEGIQ